MQFVATYAADGRRIRDYSLEALLRLAGQRRVYFTYGARGRLLHATFLPHDAARILRTAQQGTSYSYQERALTRRAWRHAPMFALRDADGLPFVGIEADLFVRSVFRAVPLSVMRRPDNVISIEEGRKKR